MGLAAVSWTCRSGREMRSWMSCLALSGSRVRAEDVSFLGLLYKGSGGTMYVLFLQSYWF